MDYSQAVEYLFTQTPLFQNIGQGAYKEGLDNTLAIDRHLGSPHRLFPTVHIAGTNGKGSVSHTLAAILQASGLKVGLYTSPHLIDFRERIKVNGAPVSKDYVIQFIQDNKDFLEPLHPSFFEVATAMAFSWFALQKVDVAVIETGLGGRLDCTNIITPKLSVITNIGYDHMALLGDTLDKIAFEKAGIIKTGIPVVIGEDCPLTRSVFQKMADSLGSPICFAQDSPMVISAEHSDIDKVIYQTSSIPDLQSCLAGLCQERNADTILHSVMKLQECGFNINGCDIRKGFANVCSMTGLMGRWQKVKCSPCVICDTGHNSHGIKYIAQQLLQASQADGFGTLRIVMGMVSDKDVSEVLKLMPESAVYYFTQASVKRAMNVNEFQSMAQSFGLHGKTYGTVAQAFHAAMAESSASDLIFVGGSTFVVADLLSLPDFSRA